MRKKFEKRRYQERTVENFCKWKDTDGKLATIILPVGTGKTFVTALCLNKLKDKKILWVAHRRELINQAYDTLSDIISWTNNIQKEIGKNKASKDSDVVVGSVQTLARFRKNIEGFVPDFIVIDEYHHNSDKNKTYKSLFDKFPNAKFVGLTATPFRFSGDELPLGEVLFEMDIGTAIKHNYLVPLKPQVLKSDVSLANVKTQMGDFATKELSKTINTDNRNKLIIDKVEELVKEGRQGVVFATDVSHSRSLCKLAKSRGITVAEVYGETSNDDRDELVKLIKDKKIQCTFNNLTMTEGTDVPHWSFVVMARPTRSLSLYIQCIGRGARKCDEINKQDAIIIDVYDKLKVKQSKVTFQDMADKGDMYGDAKRANDLLTANLPVWNDNGIKVENKDDIAKKLANFPIFIINKEQNRWTTDENYLPITSWLVATDQRLITWTEEKVINKLISKSTWKTMKIKPSKMLIRQCPIYVKHESGEGKIVDVGLGSKVQVEFEADGWMTARKEFISIKDLKVKHIVKEYSPEERKIKVHRLFYLCFPKGKNDGRVVEMVKDKRDLIVKNDMRMTKNDTKKYIVNAAQQSGVLPLVRSDAKWKKTLISNSQKDLLESWILGGKIRFDLDLDNMNKGDASAIIEQVKWQDVINSKFGTTSKSKLLGYDKSVEDV